MATSIEITNKSATESTTEIATNIAIESTTTVEIEHSKTHKPIVTIMYNKLDPNMITVSPLKETKGTLALMFSNIKYRISTYNAITCKFQTPNLKLTHYGIPRENPQDAYAKRDYIKIPEDPDNSKCIILFNKLAEFDNFFSSIEFKTKLFGPENVNKYKYKEIIYKSSTTSDSSSNSMFEQQYPRYFIVKLDTDSISKKIVSQCFVMQPNKTKELVENMDIDEYAKYIRLNSNICIIANIKSIWAHKPSKNKGEQQLSYGITIKLHQIICDPLPPPISTIPIISEFIDEEDDEPFAQNSAIHHTICTNTNDNTSQSGDEKINTEDAEEYDK